MKNDHQDLLSYIPSDSSLSDMKARIPFTARRLRAVLAKRGANILNSHKPLDQSSSDESTASNQYSCLPYSEEP